MSDADRLRDERARVLAIVDATDDEHDPEGKTVDGFHKEAEQLQAVGGVASAPVTRAVLEHVLCQPTKL